MTRSASQTATILGVTTEQVKAWAHLFKEHLSGQANPAKGRKREFSESDVLALSFVTMHWESDPDMEAIRIGLNCEDHFDDRYREILYSHTPILQEPPGDLDDTWRHGIMLNGGGVNEYFELARNYKQSAEALLDSAIKDGEPRQWGYPVLYAYRHALELYLKVIGEIAERTHSLKECVLLVEKRLHEELPSTLRQWIIEFDEIDPHGTAFRYADDESGTLRYAEFWIDFAQLKFAMGRVFKALDGAILRSGSRGRPPSKRRTARPRSKP